MEGDDGSSDDNDSFYSVDSSEDLESLENAPDQSSTGKTKQQRKNSGSFARKLARSSEKKTGVTPPTTPLIVEEVIAAHRLHGSHDFVAACTHFVGFSQQ